VRFARDLTRIAAEILAENGDPQALLKMSQLSLPSQADKARVQSGIEQVRQQFERAQQAAMQAKQAGQEVSLPPPPPEIPPQMQALLDQPSIEEVAAFLKDDQARGFVIEIETDSTIQPDEDADKQRRMEFITAIGGLIQQVVPLTMQVPAIGPFAVEAVKFAAAGFRAGRPMEATIDKLGSMVEQMAKQPQQKGPSPLELRAQSEQQKFALESEARKQEIGSASAAREQEFTFREREHQFRMLELQREDEFDRARHEREIAALEARALARGEVPVLEPV
jgi:hypothetical protein